MVDERVPGQAWGHGEHRDVHPPGGAQYLEDEAGGRGQDGEQGHGDDPDVEDQAGRARRQGRQAGPAGKRGSFRKAREDRRSDRHGQNGVGHHVDGVGKGVDGIGAGISEAVGHHHDRDDLHLLGEQPAEACSYEASSPPGDPVGEAEGRPQLDDPGHGNDLRQREGHHAHGGPPSQPSHGRLGQSARRILFAVCRLGENREDGYHGDGGQHRREGRKKEALVGLENAGEHDGEAVEGNLQGEGPQKRCSQGKLLGRLVRSQKGARDRLGRERDGSRDGQADGQNPRDERRGCAFELVLHSLCQETRDKRDDGPGERPSRRYFEQDVRHGVGRRIGLPGGGVPQRSVLRPGSDESHEAREQRENGYRAGRTRNRGADLLHDASDVMGVRARFADVMALARFTGVRVDPPRPK